MIIHLFSFFPTRFQIEKEVYFENVSGRIDVYDKNDDCIIEVKASALLNPILKPFKCHEEQIRDYMAIQDSQDGMILYQINNIFEKPRQFSYHMNANNRQNQLEKIRLYSKSILNAIEAKDPSLVKGVYDDPDLKWLCNRCPYYNACLKVEAVARRSSVRKFLHQTIKMTLNRTVHKGNRVRRFVLLLNVQG